MKLGRKIRTIGHTDDVVDVARQFDAITGIMPTIRVTNKALGSGQYGLAHPGTGEGRIKKSRGVRNEDSKIGKKYEL